LCPFLASVGSTEQSRYIEAWRTKSWEASFVGTHWVRGYPCNGDEHSDWEWHNGSQAGGEILHIFSMIVNDSYTLKTLFKGK